MELPPNDCPSARGHVVGYPAPPKYLRRHRRASAARETVKSHVAGVRPRFDYATRRRMRFLSRIADVFGSRTLKRRQIFEYAGGGWTVRRREVSLETGHVALLGPVNLVVFIRRVQSGERPFDLAKVRNHVRHGPIAQSLPRRRAPAFVAVFHRYAAPIHAGLAGRPSRLSETANPIGGPRPSSLS